jgi:uncharacterized LabA/DUF88 family protein
LFVDAGYVLADGAMAVHGTRHRESVRWDYAGLLQLLSNLAGERTGLPLLRCYWYEAAVEGRRTPDHDTLADLPGLKLRLGRMRPGRPEGVDTEIHRDLSTLARNRAISDAVIVSAVDDLAHVIGDVQDLGVRVTLVNITVDGNWTASRLLRQECDAILEVSGVHLRPFAQMVAGAEQAHVRDQHLGGQLTGASLANGHVTGGRHGGAHALPMAQLLSAPPSLPTREAGPAPAPAPVLSGPVLSGPVLSAPVLSAPVLSGPALAAPVPSAPGPAGTTPAHDPQHAMPAASGQSPAPATTAPSGGAVPAAVPAAGVEFAAVPAQAGTAAYASAPPAQFGSPRSGPLHGSQPALPPAGTGPAQPAGSGTLADATGAAHAEGLDFGGSVARDAPALWLEAVLARKPRMPSDLEARLLQGSSLPIDYLLHDEVRHALRRGFWDALERSRR